MINIQKIIFLRVEDYMSRNTEAMFKKHSIPFYSTSNGYNKVTL